MKKNGFIATSLLLSFFIIFLTMSLMIMATYTQYQGLINDLNANVLNDLNEHVIIGKYTVVSNAIINGDIPNGNIGSWPGSNTLGVNDTDNNSQYIKMEVGKYGSANFYQNISSRITGSGQRKLLVRFDVFRNGNLGNDTYAGHCIDGRVTIQGGTLNYDYMNNSYNYSLCGDPEMWGTHQFIYTTNGSSDIRINFNIVIDPDSYQSYIDVSSLYVGIKNIMVVDITDVKRNNDTTDQMISDYFRDNVPFFNDNYTMKKI